MQLDIPYVTRELPGVGGQLRANPEHFVVEEIPLYEPSGEGQHLYVNVTKRGKTTKDVQRQISRMFELRTGQIGFAGMKDKYACTTQTFSLDFGPQRSQTSEQFVADVVSGLQGIGDVEVNWARFHRNKLKPGHLLGNRFRISVSNLNVPLAEARERAHKITHCILADGLLNYFGPQRFGHQGSNVRRGLAILQGETVRADRWLRTFLLSAYQSYLCNCYLSLRYERGLFGRVVDGDIAKKYDTGGMFEVEDVTVEQQRFQDKEISFTAPIYGPKMWAGERDAAVLEHEVLARQPVSLQDFERARVQGTRRLGRLLVPDLQFETQDDLLVLQFSLPKGAFATTVVREFMKTTDDDVTGFDDES